jgi:hypothetical protein
MAKQSNRHVMGLHTKSERERAYALAKRAYDTSVKRGLLLYGLGYIEAIMDLVRDEAPDDQELLGYLGQMYEDLTIRSQA